MAHIVANLPPVKCFVRKEFLYDFEKGHGELEPCWWISIKSLRGQAFRIEAYLNNYGALYDKLPLHAFCWKPIENELPLDYLQLWDCLSYDITVIKKAQLQSMKCKFKLKNGDWQYGVYMFTVDSAHPDFNILDTGFSDFLLLAFDLTNAGFGEEFLTNIFAACGIVRNKIDETKVTFGIVNIELFCCIMKKPSHQ